jgi:hypothetical protein
MFFEEVTGDDGSTVRHQQQEKKLAYGCILHIRSLEAVI